MLADIIRIIIRNNEVHGIWLVTKFSHTEKEIQRNLHYNEFNLNVIGIWGGSKTYKVFKVVWSPKKLEFGKVKDFPRESRIIAYSILYIDMRLTIPDSRSNR